MMAESTSTQKILPTVGFEESPSPVRYQFPEQVPMPVKVVEKECEASLDHLPSDEIVHVPLHYREFKPKREKSSIKSGVPPNSPSNEEKYEHNLHRTRAYSLDNPSVKKLPPVLKLKSWSERNKRAKKQGVEKSHWTDSGITLDHQDSTDTESLSPLHVEHMEDIPESAERVSENRKNERKEGYGSPIEENSHVLKSALMQLKSALKLDQWKNLFRNFRQRRSLLELATTYYQQCFGVLLVLLTVCPGMPNLLIGFLWGIYVTAITVNVAGSLLNPQVPEEDVLTDSTSLVNDERVENNLLHLDSTEDGPDHVVYKGWMNELAGDYDPHKYHVCQTHSVQLYLDKNILRISQLKYNVLRHAMWNERHDEQATVNQRVFDMTAAQVLLRPKNLAIRRWWSRKYPICLIFEPEAQLEKKSIVCKSEPAMRELSDDERIAESVSSAAAKPQILDPALLLEKLNTFTTDSDSPATLSPSRSVEALVTVQPNTIDEPTTELNGKIVIYLFARAHREKENWFHRLRRAACFYEYEKQDILDQKPMSFDPTHFADSFEFTPTNSRSSSMDRSTGDLSVYSDVNSEKPKVRKLSAENASHHADTSKSLIGEWMMYVSLNRQFVRFMTSFLPASQGLISPSRGIVSCDLSVLNEGKAITPQPENDKLIYLSDKMNVAWVNALGARMLWDVMRDKDCLNKIRDKIQSKLDTIKLPPFMEIIRITELNLGPTLPKVTHVSDPVMNEWGLWIDLNLEYSGGVNLMIETKVNLMKLQSEPVRRPILPSGNYADPDLPLSPESSADEDEEPSNHKKLHKLFNKEKEAPPVNQEQTPSKSMKFLNFVGKVAHSKVFRGCSENKHVKKAMLKISDMPLILMVEVKGLEGTLTVNIPPPPTDRVWYGFRPKPVLKLRAVPKVGEKNVSIGQVKKFIEEKMVLLFEKNIVLPNMDDLNIPVMRSGLLNGYNV